MSFDIVTVNVGNPEKAIHVHKEVLCRSSPYFRNAFSGQFKEANAATFSLFDVSEQTFRVYVQWAYSQIYIGHFQGDTYLVPDTNEVIQDGKMTAGGFTQPTSLKHQGHARDKRPQDSELEETNDFGIKNEELNWGREWKENSINDKRIHEGRMRLNRNCRSQFDHLVHGFLDMFIFADMYDIPQLRDDIISAMIGYFSSIRCYPLPDSNAGIFSAAFSNLPSSSSFCRLLVNIAAVLWRSDGESPYTADKVEFMRKSLPHDFVFDLMMAQRARHCKADFPVEFVWILEPCHVHEHLTFDKRQCRERALRSRSIFIMLARACALGDYIVADPQAVEKRKRRLQKWRDWKDKTKNMLQKEVLELLVEEVLEAEKVT